MLLPSGRGYRIGGSEKEIAGQDLVPDETIVEERFLSLIL